MLAKVGLIVLTAVGLAQATPIVHTFNNFNPASSDPHLIGDPMSFWIQQVVISIDTNNVAVQIKTNYNNPNLNPFAVGGKNIAIGDFFFTNAGTIAYGVPLVNRSSDDNGNGGGYAGGALADNTLYHVLNVANGTLTSNQAMGNINPSGSFGFNSGIAVWLYNNGPGKLAVDSASVTPQSTPLAVVGNGSTTGLYDISFSINRSLVSGGFNALMTSNSWGFQFSSGDCANDYLTGSVPEPGTFLLLGLGVAAAGLSRRGRGLYRRMTGPRS